MANLWDKKDRRRKLSIRDPKQRILICTEGMTEKLYFDAFRMSSAKICSMGYNALKTVEEAVSMKKQLLKMNEGFHQYWVVFDNDDNPPDQIMKAIRLAEANKFFWAFSNPSFEIWYLFHFTR
jgi:hypothetical protein